MRLGFVSYEDALMFATSPDELRLAYEGLGSGTSAIHDFQQNMIA